MRVDSWVEAFVKGRKSAPLLALSVELESHPLPKPLVAVHCAACHGADGEGGGPVAAVMAITVPNLRTLARRGGGAFPGDAVSAYIDGREQRAAHGTRTMPVWGDLLPVETTPDAERSLQQRIAALVDFIERLQYP